MQVGLACGALASLLVLVTVLLHGARRARRVHIASPASRRLGRDHAAHGRIEGFDVGGPGAGTLVKSPPELWAELSDPETLARHLGEFGEIRITRTEPETAVAWEGEQRARHRRARGVRVGHGGVVERSDRRPGARAAACPGTRRSGSSTPCASWARTSCESSRPGRRSPSRSPSPSPSRCSRPPARVRASSPACSAGPPRPRPSPELEPEPEPGPPPGAPPPPAPTVRAAGRARRRRVPRPGTPGPARAAARRGTGVRRRAAASVLTGVLDTPRRRAPPPVLAGLSGRAARLDSRAPCARRPPRPTRRSSPSSRSCARPRSTARRRRGREAARRGQVHGARADREAARPRLLPGARHVRPPPHERVRHGEEPAVGRRRGHRPRHDRGPPRLRLLPGLHGLRRLARRGDGREDGARSWTWRPRSAAR